MHYETFSIPFSLVNVVETAHFVSREPELQTMRTALRGDGTRRSVTLHGLGGIGKTQLAIAYAVRHKDDYSAIFWVNSKDEDSVRQSFAKIANQIAREHPTAGIGNRDANTNVDEMISAVKAWLSLSHNTQWLLIYDNYDNPRVLGNMDRTTLNLRDYFPESHHGCIIVTTRSSEVNIGRNMRLEKLKSLKDSLDIISFASGRGELEQGR